MLAPDGAGVDAVPGADLAGRNLTMAYLIEDDLTGANLGQANFLNADFFGTTLADAEFTGTEVRGAILGIIMFRESPPGRFADTFIFPGIIRIGTGITIDQLYSTASYQTLDLSRINLELNNLAGVNFAGQKLANAVFTSATLINANFSQANLTNTNFGVAQLTGADLTGADMRGASFYAAALRDADFTDADVRGADFHIGGGCGEWSCAPTGTGITLAQLYSTASYQDRGLSGASFTGNEFTGGNFATQNLTDASFAAVTLTDANFTGADVRGADFTPIMYCYKGCRSGTGITLSQLYSTASYHNFDLRRIGLSYHDLVGGIFAGQNLADANFSYVTLNGENFSRADARGAIFYPDLNSTNAVTTNFIRPDGHINGLDLGINGLLLVRDYDGDAATILITVDQHLTIGAGGTLRMVFEADAWDSTISFAPDIPVTLGGTLELTFATDVNLASQVGRTFAPLRLDRRQSHRRLRRLQPVRLGSVQPLHHRRSDAHSRA